MPEQDTQQEQVAVPAGFLDQIIKDNEALMKQAGQQPMLLQMPAQQNQGYQWEMESLDVIEAVEHTFRGHKRKKDNTWDTSHEKEWRMMNDLGIFRLRAGLELILNKNTYLSNLDEKKTLELIRFYAINLASELGRNYEEWDINPVHLDYIHELLVFIVAHAEFRQMGGGERTGRWQTVTENRSIVQQMPMQPGVGLTPKEKKGLFGLGLLGL